MQDSMTSKTGFVIITLVFDFHWNWSLFDENHLSDCRANGVECRE